MAYDPHKHHRRSIRLKNYDYSQAGAYFVTICTQDRLSLWGEIEDGRMVLNDAGKMVQATWQETPNKFPSVELDACVIMPNHIHFVVVLEHMEKKGKHGEGKHGGLSLQGVVPTKRPTLFRVVQWFKSFTTAKYRHGVHNNNWQPFHKRVWQRNYWEHIIRNEDSLHRIRQYIHNNPTTWHEDKLHPDNE